MVEVRNIHFWSDNVKERDILGDLIISEMTLLKLKKNIFLEE
jgi:hypothetical protein